MFVVIGGGGRTGTQLASLMVAQGHEVHLIEHRRAILARLHRELPTEVVFEGHPTDPLVLEQAGIERTDLLAACADEDAQNLSMCFVARTRYRVPRTIARINNPRNAWLFDQKFHVDAAVNQAEIMAGLIEEEMSPGTMMTLLKLQRGNYALVEEKIASGAEAIGVALKDLPLPRNCVIAAIIRRGEIVMPRGVTVFEVGDEVLAVTDREGAAGLAKLLTPA
ncbi:MAG: TrkA family potassium uptake protein [Anaerolineales bacterium]|nr:TrkA family potassium uptake protein [Anaerolineales bacterium]